MFFLTDSNLEIEPESIQHAYLAILNGDLSSAVTVFKSIPSPRAEWGEVLCQILNGKIIKNPTYFQIRNFLEIDMDFLLKNEKINYVEMLLGSLDYLVKINQEAYKFAARVMFENKLYKASQQYMEKSKHYFYQDPELHFMLAKLYLVYHDYLQADYYIDECLKILPQYYPAKLLKAENAKNLLKN